MILLVVFESNTFTSTSMYRWQHDQLNLHKSQHRKQADFAGVKHNTLKNLDPELIPTSHPKTSEMKSRLLTSKLGQRLTIRSIWIRRTRWNQSSKTVAGSKNPYKAWIQGEQRWFSQSQGTYVRKRGLANGWSQLQGNWSISICAQGGWGAILLELAAANGDKVPKADTKQAYLYGDMGDEVVCIRPRDWWQE